MQQCNVRQQKIALILFIAFVQSPVTVPALSNHHSKKRGDAFISIQLNHRMQRTRSILKEIVDRYGSQKELALKCGIGETDISRIVSGKTKEPSPQLIGKICEAVHEDQARLLAHAYFRAYFPESIRLLLSGDSLSNRVRDEEEEIPIVAVEEDLDQDLAFLRQKAVHDKTVRHWLHLSARTISGTGD